MHTIEVSELTKTYPGGVQAVKGVDFDVRPGEVFGVLGPNGAGKSTIVGMLTTTIVPSAGTARVAGHDVARQPLQVRGASSVVFQEAVVDGTLSGRANLELHAKLWGVPAHRASRRIAELTRSLGIDEITDRRVDSYSGGQRRRLEIVRALISEPQVLFLDEPTVGLDPRIRHELLDVIGGLRGRRELTILITTHYLEEAQRLCDRVAIIHEGSLVALDSPKALLSELGEQVLELRATRDPMATLQTLTELGVAGDDAFAIGADITVPLHNGSPAGALEAIDAARLPAERISTRAPTLDDVYLQFTANTN
jgi:ABC-2 type transport system ATP-binding protein